MEEETHATSLLGVFKETSQSCCIEIRGADTTSISDSSDLYIVLNDEMRIDTEQVMKKGV